MDNNLKSIYDRFPPFIQSLLLTAFSIKLDHDRYGGRFNEFKELLNRMQYASPEQITEYQNANLRKIITHAYETVPYYKELFKENKLQPEDIQSKNDLYKIPVLTREMLVKNFENLRSRAFSKKELVIGHTSGTTGSPLEIYYDPTIVYMTYALLDRQYEWANVKLKKFGDRIGILRGNIIVPINQEKPPFWRYNYLHNQVYFSSFHLSAKNLDAYIDEIFRFKPAVLDGYPSTLYVVAKHLSNTGKRIKLKAAFTSSETLYDFQRELIEDSFQCKVFDYYGAAERVMFATECDRREGHHISSEFGITEILDSNNQPVTAGEQGFVVGTSLHNYGMPLIRYRTSDITGLKTTTCSCGRNLPLMNAITTKAEDTISLEDGRLISPSVLTHPFKPMHSVDASQIIQNSYKDILIKIVPNEMFSEKDEEYLQSEFTKRLGADVNIEIRLVDELERNKSGKFKWVISNVEMKI